MTTVYWTATSKNGKTGNIPGAWIGEDKEKCRQSCKDSGCPLFKKEVARKLGLLPCYAHVGRVNMAFSSVLKAAKLDPERYSLDSAFSKAARSARVGRFSVIGNAGILSMDEVKDIKKGFKRWNLGVLGYFYGWKKYSHLKKFLMASTASIRDADNAISQGFRPATVLPANFKDEVFETPNGNIGLQCLAITQKNVNCNQCGLCVREWDPLKELKRLKAMGIVSKEVYKRIKNHPKAKSLIIGFVTHR